MYLLASAAMAADIGAQQQLNALLRGSAEVIRREDLEDKLRRSAAEGRPLRVKLGIDPSRPDLHLGHAVPLRKLRQFQELGHTAVLIIGDFTGRVGDPSGASETRPFLSEDQIEDNARTYLQQAEKVLDMARTEVHHNSEWLSALTMADVLELASTYTVARMLERDDFQSRYRQGRPISVVEFLYPLMQAMDSVRVRADVEMGGTDQTFNLLVGRDVQKAYGQEPQVVFTMPLLEGTDGRRKMSKSFDNYIGLTDPPQEMFGKLMSIPDTLIPRYVSLCTSMDEWELKELEEGLAGGSLRPDEQKRRLAREVVASYHGREAASKAEEDFNKVHRDRELPGEVRELRLPQSLEGEQRVWVPRLLAELGLVRSNAEGVRLISQGGVRIDGEKLTDPDADLPVEQLAGRVLQKGRREFVRIVGPGTSVDVPS